ncbi:MAG TPA: PAS domain-containing protein [Xanthobacteraceae bacterium]|nr:PAS domain-containing protein [Xanthobacteraceae bacterium]
MTNGFGEQALSGIAGRPAIDRSAGAARSGSIPLVLLVALLLIGGASGIVVLGRGQSEPYILVFLGVLATIGVFGLFALASGILRLSSAQTDNSLIKAVVDDAFDGVIVTDSDGQVIYANSAYLDLIGATDARDARPVERVFMGDADASEAIYRLLKAAREGERTQQEVRIAAAQGRPARWLRMKVRPLGAGKRHAGLTVWSLADVTRDRERQENVFLELQRAIDYLDHAPAGFFSADANGNIVYLNATLANWLGQDLAQVGSGGLKLADLVSGDGAALLTTLRAAPGEVKTEVVDLDLKTRSGRTLPVRLFHKLAFGADGSPGPSLTLALNRARDDGTEPQRAAEVRFMRFFHHTPMAIATIDRDGGIVRTNALFARLFQGLTAGGGKGRSIRAIVSERDWSALETAVGQAAQGRGDIAPVDAGLAGEVERFGRFYVTAVGEQERDQEAAIVYALETTEQRALEAKLVQQQKMESIGQLAAGLAHDFNNMLNAILLATDFLLNAHKPTDPSFQDIMEIRQSANRAASLVRHLLAFSRKQTLRPQVLDLGEVLSDLSVVLRRLIGEKIDLRVVHGRDLWPVKADLLQFEQVVTNLAVNARDAMPDGGRLQLRSSNITAQECERYHTKGMPVADYVLIEVADTGMGIPEAIRDKVFVPFFTTKDVGKGTGLGLSTVYGIVKQTGGFVYFDSIDGKGTTFRIFLPRHVASAREAAAPVIAIEAPAITGALDAAERVRRAASADLTGEGTILLVEDEEGLRALNARGLASRGYTVLQAGNGVEAIDVLEKSDGKIDLVVSDVVMPEMDGPTLLRELRARNPSLKFIFVSGYAEDAFQKHLPADGQQFDFLPKPFTLKQLVAKVKETMAA